MSTNNSAPFNQYAWELGDQLVAYLNALGIEYVFGVPGGAIEPLYNALARSEREGGIRSVVARHEGGAAFMASAYAYNSGKLGVCCATTGPGATNLITGVASAYSNDIPLLVLTAQTSQEKWGRGALQESSDDGVDIVNMFAPITGYSHAVLHVNAFEPQLLNAISSALDKRLPAHLSIPVNILRTKQTRETLKPLFTGDWIQNVCSDEDIARLKSMIEASKKPVFLLGDTARYAIGHILDLANMLRAEIVTNPHAKGLVNPFHPRFRGVYGFGGHLDAIKAVTDSDLVICIGANFGEWSSNNWDLSLMNNNLVHIDVLQRRFRRSPGAKHILGDVALIFDRLLSRVSRPLQAVDTINSSAEAVQSNRAFQLDDEQSFLSEDSPIKPQRLMRELPKLFPPHTRYLADPGNSMTWATHYLHPFDRRLAGKRAPHGGLFQSSYEFASMGWAIASSVGVAMALPGTPIVCLTGDGSWLMGGLEITVAIQEKLPIIFIILNDGALGMVKHGQRLAGAEKTSFELPKIDYACMAQSMGAAGHIISSPQDLLVLNILEICSRKGPTVLDVRVDGEEVPPMALRMNALGSAGVNLK
jgi:acetolactate synthase-1/2/3 large subunit